MNTDDTNCTDCYFNINSRKLAVNFSLSLFHFHTDITDTTDILPDYFYIDDRPVGLLCLLQRFCLAEVLMKTRFQ